MEGKKEILRIAITPEEIFRDEPAYICEILSRGWDKVHLRHPGASLRDMRNLIEAIPQRFHSRLRLHGHFELLNSFRLGGIQLNGRCPRKPDNYTGPYSRTCHSLREVAESGECDYVTLSPIFDSISKAGYKAAFTKEELKEIDKNRPLFVNTKVVALGGINPDTAKEAVSLGFDGYAVLGALMTAPDIEELRRRIDLFNN